MYKEMIAAAMRDGVANVETMNNAIERVDELLEQVKETHPDLYWDFIRDTHESMYGPHYNQLFAEHDTNKLAYMDADGKQRTGAHLTREQAVDAFANRRFADGVTDCDKWVALNVMYSDLCRKFTESQIVDACYLFFFHDDDWQGNGKIWEYMNN